MLHLVPHDGRGPLDLVARRAHAWVSVSSAALARQCVEQLEVRCAAVGRDPGEIDRGQSSALLLTDDPSRIEQALKARTIPGTPGNRAQARIALDEERAAAKLLVQQARDLVAAARALRQHTQDVALLEAREAQVATAATLAERSTALRAAVEASPARVATDLAAQVAPVPDRFAFAEQLAHSIKYGIPGGEEREKRVDALTDEKMAAQRKLSLAAEAIQLDVDKARGVVERKTAEKEASAVELVRATMEVERTRAAAAKAATQISLPPVFTR